MSKTTSFALGDHFREFAQRKVDEGRYASTSEVVRTGLRPLEDEEKKLDSLGLAIDESEGGGDALPFVGDLLMCELRKRA